MSRPESRSSSRIRGGCMGSDGRSKLRPYTLWAVMLLVASVSAQRATPAVEKEIRAMETRWNDARAHADVVALDRMLADGWTVVHGDGTINTKAEYLADLKSGARKFDGGGGISDFSVRVSGATAVAAGRAGSRGARSGPPQGASLGLKRDIL